MTALLSTPDGTVESLEPAVQLTASVPYDIDLLLRSCAFDLLRLTGPALMAREHRRLTLPSPWREVAGSVIDTGVQRFVSFCRDGGPQVDLHSATGLGSGEVPTGRLIASINFGTVRTTVHADSARGGFQAGWAEGETECRLVAGPISLIDFMDLLISLDWPR